MAKRSSKGPRRPKIRGRVAVVAPVLRPAVNTAFPPGVGAPGPVVHHRSVHHVIHHVGPPVRAGGTLVPGVAPRPMAAPLGAPLLGRPVARPPVVGGVGPPPGPFQVPQPPMGAPGAPVVGPGGFGPRRPFRGF